MKKLSLIIGALGGGAAGYLFSNKKLREQLANAKDAEEAAVLLGKHLQKDGKQFAKQVQDFVRSEHVQSNVTKAKTFAKQKVDDAKEDLGDLVQSGKKKAKAAAKKGKKKAAKAARSTARRVHSKVRKLS